MNRLVLIAILFSFFSLFSSRISKEVGDSLYDVNPETAEKAKVEEHATLTKRSSNGANGRKYQKKKKGEAKLKGKAKKNEKESGKFKVNKKNDKKPRKSRKRNTEKRTKKRNSNKRSLKKRQKNKKKLKNPEKDSTKKTKNVVKKGNGKKNIKTKTTNNNKKEKKGLKSSRKNGGGNNEILQKNCVSESCLKNVMSSFLIKSTQAQNFDKQFKRVKRFARISKSKSEKRRNFTIAALKIMSAGGGNKTQLTCHNSNLNLGAREMTNVVDELLQCEENIERSCNSSDLVFKNLTKVFTHRD